MVALFWGACASFYGEAWALTAPPPPVDPAPFSWIVESAPDGKPVRHYLIGSVHVLPESAYPLPQGLEQAYANAEGLVLETDPAVLQEADFQKRMLDAARAPAGLKSTIPPELYTQLQQRARAAKLPMTLCDPFKAWFCALSLELFSLQTQGISGDFGLDRYFYERSVNDDRPVSWLESPESQLSLFTQMGDPLSAQFLASTVAELGATDRSSTYLIKQWQNDDRAGMEQVVIEMKRDYPLTYEHLLGERNRAWIAPLEVLLRGPQTQLIVVGSAHLVGPDGVPALLEARGWKIKALTAEPPAVPTREPKAKAAALR
ncbi:TraB/GumN family protein [Hydrocarboniphaga sp.]|uniref:TraB/GumN family protein n=1 Tax=Hydrocarboniphaga TaxID=243627 RepID=UPI002AB87C57|nr:TraB/GumN family protein [Hydrocarboniphaga sp.]MDZ4079269.1 TraB/GumN family protein [Hydrocarboniphaga sp.]